MSDLKIGYTACYIKDYDFIHIVDISEEVAVAWVKKEFPDILMSNYVKAKDLTLNKVHRTNATGNGWGNKQFIVVAYEHGKWIALNNHDGNFGVYIER